MLRLVNYKLNNFKNVRKSGKIGDKYLTILTGVNSGGKSTLIQPLLVLKDLVSSKNATEINFTGEHVELGNYYNVAQDPSKPIELHYSFGIERDNDNENLFLDILDNMNLELGAQNEQNIEEYKYIRVSLSLNIGVIESQCLVTKFHVSYRFNKIVKYLGIEYENNAYRVSTNSFSTTFDKDFFKFILENKIENFNNSENEFIKSEYQFSDFFTKEYSNIQIVFDNNIYPKIVYPGRQRHSKTLQINRLYNYILREILEELSDNINYLGPLRDEPKLNYYIKENKFGDIGKNGENAPLVFYKMSNVSNHKFILPPTADGTFVLKRNIKPYVYFVNKWASYILGRPIEFTVTPYGPHNYGLFQTKEDQTRPDSMTNVGVGSSQLFPILVEGIRKKNGVLIIEQPELHLHPSAQSRLADFFIAVSLSNYMKLLIETHSEHLLNRIVRRIVRKEAVRQNISVKFITGQDIKEIEMNELGIITDWPEDFFDTYNKEQEMLYIDQKNRLTNKNFEVDFDEL